MARKDDLALVAATLRRARSVQAVLAGTAVVAAVLFFVLWWQAYQMGAEPWRTMVMLLLWVGCGWLAARFVALFRIRLPIEASTVYALLRDQPQRVRWVFPRTTYLRLGRFQIGVERVMMVLTDDGRAYEIHGVRNDALQDFEKVVRRLAPDADFGLSEKNRQRYQKATGIIVR